MELLEGEDLSARVPLPWRTTCAHLRDACQALGLLHARRLVHRDISPRNLWRTPDGRIKLLDFGALAPFGPSEVVIGTPPLVPPEAIHRLALSERSDLYSLGALAYYLLTGRHAFPAQDVRQLLELWAQAPALPSTQLMAADSDQAIPPELDRLVLALLHPEDLARPSSAADRAARPRSSTGSTRCSAEAARLSPRPQSPACATSASWVARASVGGCPASLRSRAAGAVKCAPSKPRQAWVARGFCRSLRSGRAWQG
jgi:serine/threonine protein kinase